VVANPGHLPAPHVVRVLRFPRPAYLLPCLPGAGGWAWGWLLASLLYPQMVVYGFDALDLLGNLHGSLRLCGAGYNAG
jgi:hypothetical protein